MARKAPRDPKDIMAEYAQAAGELGDLVYKLQTAIPKRVEELNALMLELNREHAVATAAKEIKSNG